MCQIEFGCFVRLTHTLDLLGIKWVCNSEKKYARCTWRETTFPGVLQSRLDYFVGRLNTLYDIEDFNTEKGLLFNITLHTMQQRKSAICMQQTKLWIYNTVTNTHCILNNKVT